MPPGTPTGQHKHDHGQHRPITNPTTALLTDLGALMTPELDLSKMQNRRAEDHGDSGRFRCTRGGQDRTACADASSPRPPASRWLWSSPPQVTGGQPGTHEAAEKRLSEAGVDPAELANAPAPNTLSAAGDRLEWLSCGTGEFRP